jgi:hypothetical protein
MADELVDCPVCEGRSPIPCDKGPELQYAQCKGIGTLRTAQAEPTARTPTIRANETILTGRQESAHSRQDNWTLFAQTTEGENRMATPKSTRSPPRKGGDTSQAGCREFESRPPLLERRVTVRIFHTVRRPSSCAV